MTPPAAVLFRFWGYTPSKATSAAPLPLRANKDRAAPRRAALSFCLDAGRTTHAATRDAPRLDRPARITEYLRKDKRAREKSWSPAVFMLSITPARRMFPPCFSLVSCLPPSRVARNTRPAWSFPGAGARGRSGRRPRTSNRRIFCASNRARITENLRKTGPPDRPIFAF